MTRRNGRFTWLLFWGAILIPAGAAWGQVSEDTPGWFPFTIPGLDASPSPIDLAHLNAEPAGAHGRLRRESGHLVDGRGRRVRLFGTNLTATSCFPEKEVAPLLAAHLAKLGFNVVRLHFMDTAAAPTGIFARDMKGLDPQQLDKMDYLVAELKRHGIYTNLNLHVAYRYDVPIELVERHRVFRLGKVLDQFYTPFLESRKRYARELLSHRNPYTDSTYAEEPAIAGVELNNENTLLQATPEQLRALPKPFAGELKDRWHGWLQNRYGSTDKLRSAWDVGSQPLGNELLNPGSWIAQTGGAAEATLETDVSFSEPPLEAETPGLRYRATRPGAEGWHLQFFQQGLTLDEGEPYTLSFHARADEPKTLNASVMLQVDPWGSCGLSVSLPLDRKFQPFRLTFRARRVQPEKVRLNFSTNNQTGVFELAGVSLRAGGIDGLPEGESLENRTVSFPAGATEPANRNFAHFLQATERETVREMVRYLKEDLGVKAPISNTQASYGGAAGVLRESQLCDYVDMHAYWEHPHFPGRAWDRADWRIPNTSQATSPDGGALARLAAHRVSGMPFTVSEYNVPAPNDHAAELFPLLSAVAAFQDWDGIYQYTYSNFTPDWQSDAIKGYFDLCGHTGQLAFAPVGALIFRRGLVAPARRQVILDLPATIVDAPEADYGTANMGEAWGSAGVTGGAVAMHGLAVRVVDDGEVRSTTPIDVPAGARRSDTSQIVWNAAEGMFTVNAPAARLAVGPVERAALGDAVIESDGRFACFAAVALDERPLATSRKTMVVAVARVENQDMGWNEDRTSVGTDWGEGPTMCEGADATVTLPGAAWHALRLDGTGKPIGPARGKETGSAFVLEVRPDDRTIWYLLTR
ncbi:MAG: alpha-amylase family protein [Planctomycetota bacterium]|jgi:hypothetical protein